MRRTLGALVLAGPFVAGALAAASARRDFRILAMAIVATITAWVIGRKRDASAANAVLTFVGTSVAAAATAVLSGARAPFGVIAVAVVVAAFAVAGQLLLSKPRGEPSPSATRPSNER